MDCFGHDAPWPVRCGKSRPGVHIVGPGRLTTRWGKDRRPAELICPQWEQQRRHGRREGPPLGRRGISGLLPGPRWTTTTRLPWRGRRVLGRENPVPVVEMERRSARYVF
jgi:hypothetical protein